MKIRLSNILHHLCQYTIFIFVYVSFYGISHFFRYISILYHFIYIYILRYIIGFPFSMKIYL